jgi:hypothetical protein
MEDIFGNAVPDGFIIFQDIDGPLVSYERLKDYEPDGHHKFKPAAVKALNQIIAYYDAALCMVSAWNSQFMHKPEPYAQFLRSRGLVFRDLIVGDNHSRPEYVMDLINKGLKHYLVIDDEAHQYYSFMGLIQYKRILQPNSRRCLDRYDVWWATKNFKLNV